MDNFYFFFGADSPFSNWHPAKFEYAGHIFSNSEQAMMWAKANLFGDTSIAEEILRTTSPRTVKALGRKVNNFNTFIWNDNKVRLVEDIVYAKFNGNVKMKNAMIKVGTRDFVEASPFDKVWGTGIAVLSPGYNDRTKWRGKNLLGDIMTRVSKRIHEENEEEFVLR